MPRPRPWLAATALLALATTAQTPPPRKAVPRIPDGSYTCQTWIGSSYVTVGSVRSVAGALKSNPLAKVGATITGVAPTREGITISYTTARGYRESMDCARG